MNPIIRAIANGAISFVLASIIIHFLLPVLHALKAGQPIREIGPTWHNNKSGTPIMGGLMFIFSSLLCLLGNLPWMTDYTPFYVFLLAFSFGLIGFLDDFFKVKYKHNLGLTAIQKALLQMLVSAVFVCVLYFSGSLTCDLRIPFTDHAIHMPLAVYIIFAMFVMVGCDNAVNLTDGVDGLSSSVTIPVMIFFTAASIAMDRFDLAVLPAAMVGGLLAYLRLNWHPAKLFMGDTGSLFMGGVVCAMSFALDMPLILILVGFVYICETLSVILQVSYFKLTHGKRLFKMSPIHHHFEMCGWKEEKIVAVFTLVSAAMCILAWLGISRFF